MCIHFPKFDILLSCIPLSLSVLSSMEHCYSSLYLNTYKWSNAYLKQSVFPEAKGVHWVPFVSQKNSAHTSLTTLYCTIITGLLLNSLCTLVVGSVFMVPECSASSRNIWHIWYSVNIY